MNYFVIGDIHGCYHTFCSLLEHWNSKTEHLICVGDLIDRGKYSWQVLEKCFSLMKDPNVSITVLKGNHEAEFIQYVRDGHHEIWTAQCGTETLIHFEENEVDLVKLSTQLVQFPLKFEKDYFIVTHAGISDTSNPYEEDNWDGVLWNRNPLKNIGKLQIHGHTPLHTTQPLFTAKSCSYNIDNGIYYSYGLSGIKLDEYANIIDIIVVPTDQRDLV